MVKVCLLSITLPDLKFFFSSFKMKRFRCLNVAGFEDSSSVCDVRGSLSFDSNNGTRIKLAAHFKRVD